MSTLPEQFSAARKAQVDAQIHFLNSFTAQAVESTRKLVELNLAAARASMEQSTAAVCELMTVKDPRDLLALRTQGQASFDALLQYGRGLAGLATQAAAPAPAAVQAKAAPQAELPLPLPMAEKFTPAIAPAVVPDVAPDVALEAVAATPKPIARAAAKAASKAPARPAAAPVPLAPAAVVVTSLKAVEAAPRPAPASGKPALTAKGASKGQEAPAPKAKKKK